MSRHLSEHLRDFISPNDFDTLLQENRYIKIGEHSVYRTSSSLVVSFRGRPNVSLMLTGCLCCASGFYFYQSINNWLDVLVNAPEILWEHRSRDGCVQWKR